MVVMILRSFVPVVQHVAQMVRGFAHVIAIKSARIMRPTGKSISYKVLPVVHVQIIA